VAIPELRAQLFEAAERLLAREGPTGLSSRAITTEAGCAKGVLHNHFTDLDGFLAEFAVDRLRQAAQHVSQLPGLAGQATVVDNLVAAAESLFGSNALAIAGVVMSRPALMQRLQHSAADEGAPTLSDLEPVFARYLDAEKGLGRVSAGADSEAIGQALVATAHHLYITQRTDAADVRLRRIVEALVTPTDPTPGRQ
jgi:AcrR family transcriptional regulator